jgi:hypothetical protein
VAKRRRRLRIFLAIAALTILPVVAYIGYIEWDMHSLSTMCSEVRPDTTTLAQARAIVTKAGRGNWLPDGADVPGVYYHGLGVPMRQSGMWEFAIPAPTTMGIWPAP